LLKRAIFGDYDEGKYSAISKIVLFMKSESEGVQVGLLKKYTFIVGPTGAGKSTLMCDFVKPNNLVISENIN
jgi:putative ribosome biogenesis GTPase RsgA